MPRPRELRREHATPAKPPRIAGLAETMRFGHEGLQHPPTERPAAIHDRPSASTAGRNGSDAPPPRSRHAGWRWTGAVVLLVAGLRATASVAARYARNEILNTDTYVATVTPLASDPAVQNAVANRVSSEVIKQVDMPKLINHPADGTGRPNADAIARTSASASASAQSIHDLQQDRGAQARPGAGSAGPVFQPEIELAGTVFVFVRLDVVLSGPEVGQFVASGRTTGSRSLDRDAGPTTALSNSGLPGLSDRIFLCRRTDTCRSPTLQLPLGPAQTSVYGCAGPCGSRCNWARALVLPNGGSARAWRPFAVSGLGHRLAARAIHCVLRINPCSGTQRGRPYRPRGTRPWHDQLDLDLEVWRLTQLELSKAMSAELELIAADHPVASADSPRRLSTSRPYQRTATCRSPSDAARRIKRA